MTKPKNDGPESGDTGPGEDAATPDAAPTPTENVDASDYTTNGGTKVAVPRGYRFVPTDKTIPVITWEGVTVTAEQAAVLVEESDKLVLVVENDDKEGE